MRSSTVENNYAKLAKFIKSHGQINTYGNAFVSDHYSGADYTAKFTVEYDETVNKFNLYWSEDAYLSSGAYTEQLMRLGINPSNYRNVYVKSIVIVDGEGGYSYVGDGFFDPCRCIKYDPLPIDASVVSISHSSAQKLAGSQLSVLLACLNDMIYPTGMTAANLGFEHFE